VPAIANQDLDVTKIEKEFDEIGDEMAEPVTKERVRKRLGAVTTEEMAAMEDGLRQIMQLG
jgi:hypothetical protein